MMKKILFLLVANVSAIVAYNQCPNSNPSNFCPATDGSLLVVGNRVHQCTIYAGEYHEINNLVAGNTYRVDFCGIGLDPAPSYNSILTVYTGGGALVGFNDNFCGDDSQFDFVAPVSGTYRFLANVSGNCPASNGANTPLAITLVSVGAAPEINVQGNATSIVDGDITPTTTDHTDFGNQSVCAGNIVRTFTIQNTGTANLSISSVIIGGTHASDFSITASPATLITGGASTTFQVTFNPSAAGTRNATITINNNDANEAVYDFAIQGNGTDPEIDLQGNGISIIDGDASPSLTDHTQFIAQSVCTGSTPRTFTIQNTGNSNLNLSAGSITLTGTHAADFSISGITLPSTIAPSGNVSFVVNFNPSASGFRNATLNIANNDCDEAIYDVALTGQGVDPEINLNGNGNSIVSGDVTPSLSDNTDFGSQSVCSGTVTRAFVIENNGNANLILPVGSVTFTGPNASDFSFSGIFLPATIPFSGAGNLNIIFDPSGPGLRTATVTIGNNDCNEGTYTFAIQGLGNDPEINVQGNSATIVDGDVAPTATDHSDFGSQSICSGNIVRTFTIQNTGNANLTIAAGAINVTGTHAADYSIGGITLPATIAAAGSTTFTVSFDPSAPGIRSATINLANNDCDESIYDFAIQGTGIDAEINIQGNATNISDGQTTPLSSNHTIFDPLQVCSGTFTRTYTIQNTGTGNLNISSATITGTHASDFTITTPPSTTVASGSSGTFVVTFNPTSSGVRQAVVNIFSNDCDESTYDFAIEGTGNADVTPPVAICQNASVTLNALGNATVTGAMVNSGSTDFCGIASLTVSPNSFTCANVGTNIVTLTVLDNSGNSSVCSASVTIFDNTPPVALCTNITANLDATGNLVVTPAMIDNGSSDACSINLSASPSAFTCANIGANTVTLTVTDPNFNVSTCTSTVTIADNTSPTAIAQNINLNLDAFGNATLLASSIDDGSSDNCGIASMVVSPNSFTCANVGPNSVTLTVTDVNGNSSTASAIVTVADVDAPIAICQNVSISLDVTGNSSITGTMLNSGSTDVCGITSYVPSSSTFNCSNVGANTVTLTVSDVNGNTSNCVSTVNVLDNIAPTAICQNINVTLNAGGNATIVPADIDNGSNDACGPLTLGVSVSAFTCANLGANTVTLTVTDNSGNPSNCAATVNVNPATPFNQNFSICDGENIIVGSNIYTISGTYTDTLSNINGCDSILITQVTVAPPLDITTITSGVTITSNAVTTSYQWIDCNNNNTPIAGAINQSYIAPLNGDYAVIVSENGCSDTSACINVNSVGIENNDLSMVSVYPNPFTDVIWISGLQGNEKIQLLNSVGQTIQVLISTGNQMELNIAPIASGLYLLQIDLNGKIRSIPLVKK